MTKLPVNQLIPLRRILLLLPLLAMTIIRVRAQSPQNLAPPDELLRTIASLDSALFASASYDRCDLEKFKTFFTDDVEFYHDQGGLPWAVRPWPNRLRRTSAA
jgi:hypothetical protein